MCYAIINFRAVQLRACAKAFEVQECIHCSLTQLYIIYLLYLARVKLGIRTIIIC